MPETLPQESREKQADILLRFLDRSQNIEALNGQKLQEVFGDEANMRKFIAEVEPEKFIELLNGLNGILRGKEKTDWNMDGNSVEVSGVLLPSEYIPPRQEDKESLFNELLAAAKEMNANGRDRKDIALLLGATINAIHAYANGNGRTSRFAYLLTKDGYSAKNKEELAKVLREDGREVVDPNPSFIRTGIEEPLLYAPLKDPKRNPSRITNVFPDLTSKEYVFRENVAEVLKKRFLDMSRKDSSYFRIAILEQVYLHGNGEEYIKDFPGEETRPEEEETISELVRHDRRVLILSRLTPKLDTTSIENVINRYWELKKEYVEKIMDCIAHPDKDEYSVEAQGEKVKLIDLFKAEIKKHQEEKL